MLANENRGRSSIHRDFSFGMAKKKHHHAFRFNQQACKVVGPWRLLQNAWNPCHWSLTQLSHWVIIAYFFARERIYSQGPRVSNNQLIGFWKLIQLFLKHHVVLQNTHQNCMWAVLETFDVALNWFDCFPDGFMNSKKNCRNLGEFEDLHQLLDFMVGFRGFFVAHLFPSKHQHWGVAATAADSLFRICGGHLDWGWTAREGLIWGQSWPVTILEFWVFRNFEGMINFKQMYWSGEFGGFNPLHYNFTVAINVHNSQLADGRSFKTYAHRRTLLNLFPWKVSPLSVRTLW